MSKLIFTSLIGAAILYSVFALWQRQPKTAPQEENPITLSASAEPQNLKNLFSITPQDQTVLNSKEVEIKGKVNPNAKVLIYSNTSQNVASADTDGNFSQKIDLADGLNLFNIMPLDQNLSFQDSQNLTLYYSKSDVGAKVIAGSVKSTFDNTITITTPNGDMSMKTTKNTSFDIPEDEGEPEATSEIDNIRIDDYIIATGDSQTAKTLTVIRQNKPQITEKVAIGTVGANPKQNILPIKNNSDGSLVELKLAKNTRVSTSGEGGKTADIKKDKVAIVFYFLKDSENIVDLIYLLP